jgi:hypothetical protein
LTQSTLLSSSPELSSPKTFFDLEVADGALEDLESGKIKPYLKKDLMFLATQNSIYSNFHLLLFMSHRGYRDLIQ